MTTLRSFSGKHLVSFLRGGDFAHAGDVDAIDLVMSKYNKSTPRKIADIGCGLGGTSFYIQQNGWGNVIGIDIEEESIQYAKKNYQSPQFLTADVLQIHQKIQETDLNCLFNSFYAFDDQLEALKSINLSTKKGGALAIFDYSHPKNTRSSLYTTRTATHGPFYPVNTSTIENDLIVTGWHLEETVDLSLQYYEWYHSLMNKLENNKQDVCQHFTEAGYNYAYETYTKIKNALGNNDLSGCIIYANKRV